MTGACTDAAVPVGCDSSLTVGVHWAVECRDRCIGRVFDMHVDRGAVIVRVAFNVVEFWVTLVAAQGRTNALTASASDPTPTGRLRFCAPCSSRPVEYGCPGWCGGNISRPVSVRDEGLLRDLATI